MPQKEKYPFLHRRENGDLEPEALEIEANLGFFASPSSGGQVEISQMVPSRGQLAMMISGIAGSISVAPHISKIEVCYNSINDPHGRYVFRTTMMGNSYGGPERKPEHIREGNSRQIYTNVLVNPVYRIWGGFRVRPNFSENDWSPSYKKWRDEHNLKTTQHILGNAHANQALFMRRLRQGRVYRTPFMGRREFSLSYIGFPRPEVKVATHTGDVVIPLYVDYYNAGNNPKIIPNAIIRNGVMEFEND